jgi:hypothetical protein
MGTTKFGASDSIILIILLPEEVTVNSRTIVIVLVNTVQTAIVKTTSYVVCWRMQVDVLGCQMNSKEQSKHQVREMIET